MFDDQAEEHWDDADRLYAVSIAARLLGPEKADILSASFGGTRLFFPKSPSADHPLSLALGENAARALCGELWGVEVYIRQAVETRVATRLREGASVAQIAREIKKSDRTIWRVKARLRSKVRLLPVSPTPATISLVTRRSDEGVSVRRIADEARISCLVVQRIRAADRRVRQREACSSHADTRP